MKILIIDAIHQTRNWVNINKPRVYDRMRLTGIMDDENGTEFTFVLRHNSWLDHLQGIQIDSFYNLSQTSLTKEEESFMLSRIR